MWTYRIMLEWNLHILFETWNYIYTPISVCICFLFYISFPLSCPLSVSDNKREHCFAIFWIVGEFFQVSLVLFDSPFQHLVDRGEKENVSAQDLSLHSKRQPAERLPEVVSRGDKAETPTFRDTPSCRAWLSKTHQSEVTHQVEELEKAEKTERDPEESGWSPFWWLIFGREVKVHTADAKEYIVVKRIFENIEQWHGIVAKSVHEQRLQFTFDVVDANHGHTQLLVQF